MSSELICQAKDKRRGLTHLVDHRQEPRRIRSDHFQGIALLLFISISLGKIQKQDFVQVAARDLADFYREKMHIACGQRNTVELVS